jgi:hypothetical protein
MPYTLKNIEYVEVHGDYEKRMALSSANQQGLQWVSSSKTKTGYRMKFGRYVKDKKPPMSYAGAE